MLAASAGIHAVRVVLYENERYSPLSGWSAKGLMPTDRKAYSSGDGQDGFANLEEANVALLSTGWSWEDEWVMDTGLPNADKDGWSYSADFTSFGDSDRTGSAQKGMMHFVRRRKLIRSQFFDVACLGDVAHFTCDHCDLQEVERLAALALEKIAAASLRKHPRKISHSKMAVLKTAFVGALIDFAYTKDTARPGGEEEDEARPSTLRRLSNAFRSSSATAAAAPEALTNEESEGTNEEWRDHDIVHSYSLKALSQSLDHFVEGSQTAWSIASSVLKSGDPAANLIERAQEIAAEHFQVEERSELARFVLRKHDLVHAFHCDQTHCGSACVFAIEPCPHLPCMVCYSRKWADQHDAVCPEKIVSCERVCGVTLARKGMEAHLLHDCALRPVECPYQCLGCCAQLLDKDLETHLQTQTTQHMQLLLVRVLEQQKVLTGVHKSVQQLEAQQKEHFALLAGLQTAHAAATIALMHAESKQDRNLQDQISRLDSKLSRSIANVHREVNGEVGKIQQAISALTPK